MQNTKQNEQGLQVFDQRAKVRLKKSSDWRTAKIAETSLGKSTDPFKDPRLRDGWWDRNEPPALRALTRSLGRGKDELSEREREEWQRRAKRNEENEDPDEKGMSSEEVASQQRDKQKRGEEEGTEGDFESYMPEREDNLAQWLSELPKHLDTNTDERRQLYAGLKAYISRFPAYTTFSQLRRNEVEALSALVEKLCNAGEEREAA